MDETKKVLVVAVAAFLILTAAAVAAYRYSASRPGSLVIPGGVTYLGPTPTQAQGGAAWVEQKGKIFPYSFSYPSSLSLGVFPDDPFDAVTIFWGNTNPQENLLLRIEDLNKIPNMKNYVGKSKKSYVENWWKQYNWKGVASVSEFTNSKGLKGYRAKYTDAGGTSPHDNIFFEIPGRPELVIWMSGKLLEQSIFDRIVDSVTWGK